MELKISKVSKMHHTDSNLVQQSGSEAVTSSMENQRETVTFDNGVSVHKQGEQYFLSVGGEELQITEEEFLLVTDDHDHAFELVMEKRGKFWFNASIDNVGLSRETI